jgi:hypothetical protein
VKDYDILLYKIGKKVPPPRPKLIRGENGVVILIVSSDSGYNSNNLIRPYSPNLDLDSNLEEQAY